MKEGDGELNWVDATLTNTGEQQAQAAHKFWEQGLKNGIPPADSYYTSPLYRCLQMANLTFSGLSLPDDKPFKALVKEVRISTIAPVLGCVSSCPRRISARPLANIHVIAVALLHDYGLLRLIRSSYLSPALRKKIHSGKQISESQM
jgi:hypothetical protein